MSRRILYLEEDRTASKRPGDSCGFSLIELLMTLLVLCVASAALFSVLTDIQQAAGYHVEIQSVLNNTQIAMQTVQRYIRQAGNDPFRTGLTGITIVGPGEMRLQSDLTGSAGPGNPDKGDPDGDTQDAAENVTLRFNARTRSLEIVPAGASAQIIAGYISGLNFTYYDAAGNPTASGADVRKIGVSISGASLHPDPRTGQVFGVQLKSEIQVCS